jgi:type IV fimbrial biogenesis protein FimT
MLVSRNARTQPRRLARGFTVVELGVAMGVVAILAAVAMPGFRSFVDAMDAKNVSMELVADLTAARTEALKRNADVMVLPLAGNWTNGWEVRMGDDVLGQRTALRPGTWLSAPTAGITFHPNGRLGDNEVPVANIRWAELPTRSGVQPRCVVIMPTGSARSLRGAC